MANLLISPDCKTFVRQAGLKQKNPVLAIPFLVKAGLIERPPAHAYLQHPEWRKVWFHLLDPSGIQVRDEVQAVGKIKELESEFFESPMG